MQLRVGVVDDHPAVALGATVLINAQPDMMVVGSAVSVHALLDLDQRYDVVLLDLMLPDSSPSENVRALQKHSIATIVYTAAEHPDLVREAARAGLHGFIRKSADATQLIDAIRSAARGEVVASSEWASAIDEDLAFVSARLTPRETEVLALYAAGETAEEVARRLSIARTTVLDYIRRIRAKYMAVDRPAPTKVELLYRAMEDGVLSNRPPGHDRER